MFKYAAMFVDKIGETLSPEGELIGRVHKDGGKSGEILSKSSQLKSNSTLDYQEIRKAEYSQWCRQGGACGFICTQSMHLCTHPLVCMTLCSFVVPVTVCTFHYTITASDVTCHVYITTYIIYVECLHGIVPS